ncbi:unnamed protein product [Phytomonas sp. Hart1]|nr:unnamed protein product [Phytomonas sp. Hart1]|eukprot:CCW69395.1 unnamed protein product [Phytomonas sp. isolate Hart1]
MLEVYRVFLKVFRDDSIISESLLPSEASLEKSPLSLSDLSAMSGKGRIAAFKECGIHPHLFPPLLRSLQHLTALNRTTSVSKGNMVHGNLEARYWNYLGQNPSLIGSPSVNSKPYYEKVTDIISCKPDESNLADTSSSNFLVQYNGLMNQGATCYLNSLLQSLFHISAFRSIIYQMPTKEESIELSQTYPHGTKSIPYALQRLFCMLQTETEAVNTTELTESFGWSEADSFIQHDVHELTHVLLDNLEMKLNTQRISDNLDKSVRKNAIHEIFNGLLQSYIDVEEVGYHGACEETFYDLQLVVKDTKDIYASFDRFFQAEVLDGKNKYCLERNGEKKYYRATKGVRLKATPLILLLHLTRFDYDVRQGEMKIFSRWDYYSTLDLSGYMPHVKPADTHYTLCSVLVHSGSNTGFGHYYCFLLCSGQWYKFNDERVTPASFKDVYGDNFGGYHLNYWGSLEPQVSTAYMLVYIRSSQMDSLLCPIGPEDVPKHVIDQLLREKQEEERISKGKREDNFYAHFRFLQPQDLVRKGEFASLHCSSLQKQPSHRTLRVLLEVEALPEFTFFVEKVFNIPENDQLLWCVTSPSHTSNRDVYIQLKPGVKVEEILKDSNECYILVTSLRSDTVIISDEEDAEYQLFHHKLYDPLQLKILFIGSTVVRRNNNEDAKVSIEKIANRVREMIAILPDDTQKKYKHHLQKHHQMQSNQKVSASFDALKCANSIVDGVCEDVEKIGINPLRGMPNGDMTVLREVENHRYTACNILLSGDILVWQLKISDKDKDDVFYPDVESFQHFVRHRIPVEIRLNQAPCYPTLVSTELGSSMSYEQLQRYVARMIGEPVNYDYIRFVRHNPETELPYFMKAKKKSRSTLSMLLTPVFHSVEYFSKYIYYEYCKYPVTQIEVSHSLEFKLYSDNVKAISSHWVLMSRECPIKSEIIFSTSVKTIQKDYATQIPCKTQNKEDKTENASTEEFCNFIMNLVPEDAWKELRLVDVWKGRIYNVLDHDHVLVLGHQTFEESAEYRIERIPQPIPGILPEEQLLVQVHHFTLIRQRKDPVETYGEPFSFHVLYKELPSELLRRIAQKLEINFAAVVDWKVCLVKENTVFEVAEFPMGMQLVQFCAKELYEPNQKEPVKAAFLGLDHAPIAKRLPKREEKILILN